MKQVEVIQTDILGPVESACETTRKRLKEESGIDLSTNEQL